MMVCESVKFIFKLRSLKGSGVFSSAALVPKPVKRPETISKARLFSSLP